MADDIAALGISIDTSQVTRADATLDDLYSGAVRLDGGIENLSRTARRSQGDFRSYGRAAQSANRGVQDLSRNAGQGAIQVQQFVGQIQGGVNPLIAFSQQAADLGIVLGAPLAGAVAGIAGAFATALLPALFDSENATERLTEAMETLDRVVSESDGVSVFTERVRELAVESDRAARLLLLTAEQAARDVGSAAAEGIGEAFNDAFDVTLFQGGFEALVAIAGTAGATGATISAQFRDIGEEFGLAGREARDAGMNILVSLRELQQGISNNLPDAQQRIIAFQEQLFELANNASGQNREGILRFVSSIQEYLSSASNAAERTELLREALAETGEVIEVIDSTTQDLAETTDDVAISVEDLVNLVRGETAAYEAGGDALREYIAEKQAIQILTRSEIELTAENIAILREEILERNRAREANRAFGRTAVNTANEIDRAYDRLTDTISDSFEDLFRDGLRGFDDFADSVVNIIEDMVARMLAEIATAQLSQALDLGGITSQGGGAGGLGSLGQQGGTLGAIGQALPQVALAAAVYRAGEAISEALGGDGTIGGLFGGLVGAAFGGDYETRGAGLQFGVNNGVFGGQNFENQRRSGGLFRSSRSRTLTTALDAEVEAAFNATFDNISSTVVGGLQTLGFDVADNALDAFNSGLQQIEFGEDQAANQAAVQAYFDSLSNEVAAFAQGGGISDTLGEVIREGLEQGLSVDQAIERFNALRQQSTLTFEEIERLSGALNATNIAFEALGITAFEASVQGGEFSEQLIAMAGGIEAFSTNAANFANTFVDSRSGVERLSDVFTELGLAIPSTADGLASLVQGLDLTTEEGQQAFAVITSLTDALSQYYTEQERAAEAALQAQERLTERALQLNESVQQRLARFGLEGVDAQLFDLDREFDELRREAEETGGDLVAIEELYARLRGQILEEESERILEVQRRLREESLNQARAITDSALSDLSSVISRRRSELSGALTDSLNEIRDAGRSALDELSESADRAQGNVRSLSRLFDDIGSTINDLVPQSRGAAQGQIRSAIDIARSGGSLANLDLSQALDTLSQPSQQLFGSFEDYLRDFTLTNIALGELSQLTGGQLSSEEQTLNSINAQIEATERDTQSQLDQRQALFDRQSLELDEQLRAAQEQVNQLRGIDGSLLSIDDAQQRLNEAVNAERELLGTIEETIEAVNIGQQTIIEQEMQQAEVVNEAATLSNDLAQETNNILEQIELNTRPFSGNERLDPFRPSGQPVMNPTNPLIQPRSTQVAGNTATSLSGGSVESNLETIKNYIVKSSVSLVKLYNQIDRWDGDGLPQTRSEVP